VLIGLLPLEGHVASGSADPQGSAGSALTVIAAGPAVNALMFGLVGVLELPSPRLRDFAVVNAFVLVSNLLPFSQRTPLGPQATDGLAFVRMLVAPEHELDEQRSAIPAALAQRLAELGDREGSRRLVREALATHPHSLLLWNWLGHDLVVCGRFAEAREVFGRLVEEDTRREGPTPRGRSVATCAIHLNNLAWADLMAGDPEMIPGPTGPPPGRSSCSRACPRSGGRGRSR
jgi:hypothetical protein